MKLEISQTLVSLLSEITQQDFELTEVIDSDNIQEEFMLDSIAILRLMIDIEAAFGIKIDSLEMDMELFTDFRKLIDFIEGKIDEKNSKPVS